MKWFENKIRQMKWEHSSKDLHNGTQHNDWLGKLYFLY